MTKIINYNDIKKEFDENKRNKKIEEELKRQAQDLFQQALYERNIFLAIKYANDAYELYPERYEYKTYAISLIKDSEIKLQEYQELYDEISRYIDTYDQSESLMQIYSFEERNKRRFKQLKYNLACAMIENKLYEKAYALLKDLISEDVYFKSKHLIMNIYLKENKYQEVLDLCNDEENHSLIYLIPLSYAYLKLHKYKNFVAVIKEINILNEHFQNSFLKLQKARLKNINKYHFAGIDEIYYSFKYFYEMYREDLEYVNEVSKIIDLEE